MDTGQLELARAVQQSLLPSPLEREKRFELVARFAPAQGVAGDFYDYFPLGPDAMAFYLGDVQGKGLEGAMYAALVSGIMRGLQKSGTPPAHLLTFLNQRLCLRPIPNKFCTLSYVVFEVAGRRFSYANAGLPFPLLLRQGRATRVELPGYPLGLFENATYEQQEISLDPGDCVLFFTDGLTDSLENQRERDGELVVRRLLESNASDSAEQLAERLLNRLPPAGSKHTPHLADDATFLLLRTP